MSAFLWFEPCPGHERFNIELRKVGHLANRAPGQVASSSTRSTAALLHAQDRHTSSSRQSGIRRGVAGLPTLTGSIRKRRRSPFWPHSGNPALRRPFKCISGSHHSRLNMLKFLRSSHRDRPSCLWKEENTSRSASPTVPTSIVPPCGSSGSMQRRKMDAAYTHKELFHC